MKWTAIDSDEQITDIIQKSQEIPVVVFKHSTRCSISAMALNRLERQVQPVNTEFFLLDLIRFRNLSNKIADIFKVHHESPQVLIIHKGTCIYDESHNGISMDEIKEHLAA